jgi:hypothetical protein
MKRLRLFSLAAVAAVFLALAAPSARAQVSFGIQIGSPPVCPYGYFDYAPYNCAPFGYYGPEWFQGNVFLGAGPWFHGPRNFHGWVNRRYDPRDGYRGGFPHRGERPDWGRHRGWEHNFHGTYRRHEERHEERREERHEDRHDNGRRHDHGR